MTSASDPGLPLASSDPPSRRRVPAGEIDESLIATAIARHAGQRPRSLAAKPTHPPRFVYEARFERRPPLIFKGEHPAGDDDAIVLECWAMERARELGAAVPAVVALDTSEADFPGRFAIFERSPGVALSELPSDDPARADVLRQAGGSLRLVHQVRVPGFGRLDDGHYLRSGEARGEKASWREYALVPALQALPYLTAMSLIDSHDERRFRQALHEHEPFFSECSDARLLHGDFDETHIFFDPDTHALTGIIDWGDRESGDPAWDFAMYVLSDGAEALHVVLHGYAKGPARREALMERIRVYLLADGLRLAARRSAAARVNAARQIIVDLRKFLGPEG